MPSSLRAFEPSSPDTEPVRLTILCGFLGAGKTTLLNRVLREPQTVGTAVIVNEFGEAGIDPLLVETTYSDGVLELANGCVCCTVRGELVETLVALATGDGRPGASRPQRVILETTGLADPSPILASMMTHPLLLERYVLDGVVTAIDALAGRRNLDDHNEARRQISVADRIVLTKTDVADAGETTLLRRAVASLNPHAAVIETARLAILCDQLFGCGVVDPATGKPDPSRWLGSQDAADAHAHSDDPDHGHAHHRIRSVSLVHDQPVAWDDIAGFLEILGETRGQNILRMKAIVWCRESPERPLVLHGVRGFLHPPARLSAWPDGTPRQTRIVLIGDGLSQTACRDLFAAFTGTPRVDTPDRQALEDNPLAVPGHSFS